MNIERFAGDNRIMQAMSQTMLRNEQLMKARQDEAQNIIARQTQRDMAAAYGKTIPFTAADFPSV
jgi:hypothetical protein